MLVMNIFFKKTLSGSLPSTGSLKMRRLSSNLPKSSDEILIVFKTLYASNPEVAETILKVCFTSLSLNCIQHALLLSCGTFPPLIYNYNMLCYVIIN